MALRTSTDTDGSKSYERKLSDWVAALRYEDLTSSAISKLKQSFLDGIGCALYGSSLPWSAILRDAIIDQSTPGGKATVWGTAHRLAPAEAALVNGASVHAFELDDYNLRGALHGSSVILPVVLALAEQRGGVTGRDMLVAAAAGWEVAARASRCVPGLLARGWHTATIFGAIAAATAAGRVLRLSPERLSHSISLGTLQASGLTVVQHGGMAKRLYAGRSAHTGVLAGLLAERGYTAPEEVFSYPAGGFVHTFAQGSDYNLEELTRTDVRYAAEDIAFKFYASCAPIHPALDAVEDLRSANKDIAPENIDAITVSLSEHLPRNLGQLYVPNDATSAQLNVAYSIAVLLIEGSAFIDQYRAELLSDPRVLELAGRVKTVYEPRTHAQGIEARQGVKVAVRLRDGRVLERSLLKVRADKGIEGIQNKYAQLSRSALKPSQAAELADAILHIEDLDDISLLARLTVPSLRETQRTKNSPVASQQ